jgi:hypothetical protein
MSIPSQAALTHLRTIKPNDGWTVQKEDGKKGLRLLRRNVPVADNAFLDIHYCPKLNLVVGVLTRDGKTCQVLVDEQGKPVSGIRIVSVSTYDPKSAASVNFAKSRQQAQPTFTPRRSKPATASTTASTTTLTAEQNQELVKYGLILIGICIVARVMAASSLAGLYIIALPLVYLYGVQTCPRMDSFNAKRELKRVLRGHHLSEDDPQKPRGFLEDLAARVTASVTAELATLPGYEISMTSFGGAAILADVRVPTAKTQCYWVGAFGKWRYVTSREIPDTRYD